MKAMPYTRLQLSIEDQVAWLTLNRPDSLNALDSVLVAELQSFFGDLDRTGAPRVVVMRGAGRCFCAGLDLKEISSSGERLTLESLFDTQRKVRNVMFAMRRCPQPIVSIVQGAAAGGGFALALASDIRLMTPDARMNAAFIRLGLSGCDAAVSYFLPRMVGSSVAAELLLTGRFLGAQRSFALGLASKVGELEELVTEARSLATDMLLASPLGLRLTKEVLGLAVDSGSMEAVVALEDRNQMLCAQSAGFSKQVAAFLGNG
jgi:enoyl-CoA hydratase/carnithine racemase